MTLSKVGLFGDRFRINRIESPILKYDGDCGESLTIYDSSGPDPARIIKTFCDTFSRPMEKIDFISSSPSLFVQFESKTGSYSGSSLYYWAHYDFFNNTHFGDPVPNTLCDEVMYAWKHPSGKLRSPLNSLIFKRTGGSDVRCKYKFITDRRLFARVVIEVISVSFKELHYNSNQCTRCHDEKVDKLVVWEEKDKYLNNLACFCDNIPSAVKVISSSDNMNLEMIVQGQNAITSYFKNPNPLFEAYYEFAHGPLCGPITQGPISDGEIMYPYKKALGMLSTAEFQSHHTRQERCIWEVKVAASKDVWLRVEKARAGNCQTAKLEIYLAGRLEPKLVVCPENFTAARDLTIMSSQELGAMSYTEEPPPIVIIYSGDGQPGKNAFRLVWTELFHTPRSPDGVAVSSLLQNPPSEPESYCDFKCPGDTNYCIPKHLVCNGIQDCPNFNQATSATTNITAMSHSMEVIRLLEENLEKLGLLDSMLGNDTIKHIQNDESPEICRNTKWIEMHELNRNTYLYYAYGKLIIILALSVLILILLVVIICQMFCRKPVKQS
uniref:CUB domain-containing protein n=1 Tax=Megaselia scalaris TaxID=36166 RepID=T1GE27_MEGSC